jgi:hypothetical protein
MYRVIEQNAGDSDGRDFSWYKFAAIAKVFQSVLHPKYTCHGSVGGL